MRITFTLPDEPAQLLMRLALCIRENSHAAPSVDEIVKSLVIDLLAEDAAEHNMSLTTRH